ncbi:MFS transporter [Zeimonas arvi]|uniref:MFS transporter n=1 Tax=Zeimonas arvi TaxID=2498847 RepID=A0A5C8NT09_9BURK|nr:MFS transporter [Zeimonas arvi]TXL64132.1 MFS transporter [Zeimonas arvi]
MPSSPDPQPGTLPDPAAPAVAGAERSPWTMLLALVSAFAMSQAYRTVASIMAPSLQQEFGLSAQALGLFAATFHFSFAALMLAMGIGVDLHGSRRTVLTVFPLAIAGGVVAALAPDFGTLLLAQAMIGIGCSPAFVASTVFISRSFPSERFAAISGIAMATGTIGMLLTGTPLAWLIEASSWRAAFGVLAGLSVLSWLAIHQLVREPTRGDGLAPQTLADALRGFAALLRMPHTWGIVAIGGVCYASFVTLRGLWLGPMMVDRYGLTLVDAGNLAVAATLAALFGPPGFGRMDPGPGRRRRVIVAFSLAAVVFFLVLAADPGVRFTVVSIPIFALMSGYSILLYTEARGAYPPAMAGRAISLYTMSMFLGVAIMQWLTGAVASASAGWGVPTFTAVFVTVAAMLAAGTAAFAWSPKPDTGASR